MLDCRGGGRGAGGGRSSAGTAAGLASEVLLVGFAVLGALEGVTIGALEPRLATRAAPAANAARRGGGDVLGGAAETSHASSKRRWCRTAVPYVELRAQAVRCGA